MTTKHCKCTKDSTSGYSSYLRVVFVLYSFTDRAGKFISAKQMLHQKKIKEETHSLLNFFRLNPVWKNAFMYSVFLVTVKSSNPAAVDWKRQVAHYYQFFSLVFHSIKRQGAFAFIYPWMPGRENFYHWLRNDLKKVTKLNLYFHTLADTEQNFHFGFTDGFYFLT